MTHDQGPARGALGGTPTAIAGGMSLSYEIRRHRAVFDIPHEPVCDRCGHGASLHTLHHSTPCIGCGERTAAGATPAEACIGFASEWFDNSRRRAPAA